jgi:hypothetical protein
MSTKVKSITPKTYEGKVTGYSIVLEDGVQGYLDDKGSDKDIKAGEDVIYILAVKKNKKGTDYNLLTLKRVAQSFTPQPTPTPEPAKEEKKPTSNTTIDAVLIFKERCENSRRAMQIVGGFVTGDKVNLDKVKDTYKEVNLYLQEAIDDILSE